MGIFWPQHTPESIRDTSETAGAFIFCSARDPIASPVSKYREAACPVHDTQGAGVVMPAYENIVVAQENPQALYTRTNKIFCGEVLEAP